MRTLKYIFTFVVLVSHLCLKAQQNKINDWVKGSVFLNNGDTLDGYIVFMESMNIVQYTDDKSIVKTFSSFVLSGFQQRFKEKTRTFTRFYWNAGKEGVQNIPDFFEVLYDGELKVLSKDKRTTILDDWSGNSLEITNPMRNSRPTFVEVVVRSMYIMLADSTIYPILKPRKDFINLFPEKKEELKKYFKENYIPLDDSDKIIKLVKSVEENKW